MDALEFCRSYPGRDPAELKFVGQMLLRTTESLIHMVVLEPPEDLDRATLEREISQGLSERRQLNSEPQRNPPSTSTFKKTGAAL